MLVASSKALSQLQVEEQRRRTTIQLTEAVRKPDKPNSGPPFLSILKEENYGIRDSFFKRRFRGLDWVMLIDYLPHSSMDS